MKGLSALEIRRKIFHLVMGLCIFMTVYSLDQELAARIIGLITVFGLIISLLSLSFKIPLISWFLDNFDRSNDRKIMPGKGAVYLFVGSFLVASIFEKNIAATSILILAVGDSVSHLVGASMGRMSHPFSRKKKLEGTIAGVVSASICASFIVGLLPAIAASLMAMLIEMVDFEKFQIDDNILVPFVSALVLSII